MAHYQSHYKFVGLQFSQQKKPSPQKQGHEIKSSEYVVLL